MRRNRYIFWMYLFLFGATITSSIVSAQQIPSVDKEKWGEVRGTHFIAYYQVDDKTWANDVVKYAERYYESIAKEIGYARYDNFWTWDQRVAIFLYPDHEQFIKETGQPEWSSGSVIRHKNLYATRIILSYRQENGFLDGVLAHEISHLMIRDFIGVGVDIPVWLDEGIAQLNEKNKKRWARYFLKPQLKENKFIPFVEIMTYNVYKETDTFRVAFFYAQTVSMVDFLIDKYGSQNFGQLCSELKKGKSFEEALINAYAGFISSLDDYEKKWLRYMKRK